MGRKKKSLIEKSPFKLRHRKLADGRLSLFLDRSVNGGHEYEFLQLYLVPETSTQAKRQNARTLRKAEDIRRERAEALLNAKVEAVPESTSSDMLLSDWMAIVRKNHEHRGARDLNGIDNARKNLLKFRVGMSGSVMWTSNSILTISTGSALPARPHGANLYLPKRRIPIIRPCAPH